MSVLSIVLISYNTEQYVAKSIKSVIGQRGFEKMELIVVDDGSTDGSAQVIRQAIEGRPNVQFFQKVNGGQGSARNYGIDRSSGKYITFVDSDDLVPKDSYIKLVTAAEMNKSEVVCGCIESFGLFSRWLEDIYIKRFNMYMPSTTIDQSPWLMYDIHVCNKIYLKELLSKNNIKFPQGRAKEDFYFITELYTYAKAVSVIPEIVYRYRKDLNSRMISGTKRLDNRYFGDIARVSIDLDELLASNDHSHLKYYKDGMTLKMMFAKRFERKIQIISGLDEWEDFYEEIIGGLKHIDMNAAKYLGENERIAIGILLSASESRSKWKDIGELFQEKNSSEFGTLNSFRIKLLRYIRRNSQVIAWKVKLKLGTSIRRNTVDLSS